ncbi:uncharacterized protein LOC144143283 [Haemaphysalis longicornis]
MCESAASSSNVDGIPVSTPQSLHEHCGQGDAVLRASSVKGCPFCPCRLVSLDDFTEHFVQHHKISLRISAMLDLLLEMKHADAARDKSLWCPFCKLVPRDKCELQKHIFEEFDYAPVLCETCSYSTFSWEDLKEHFRVTHPHRRPACTLRADDDFESWVASFVASQKACPMVLEKPYQCVHCAERHRCTKELRMHLYEHLQYYPHHCTICEKCFTSQQEIEEHHRTSHGATGVYSSEEVRFEDKERKIDDLLDKAAEKLVTVVEGPPGRQCMWEACPYSSSNPTELVAHMKAHIQQRKVCTMCQFSSYCDDVIAWHKRQHSHSSSSHEILPNPVLTSRVPKVKSRAYGCCWCKYRASSSMEIRTHCKASHPGKPVKLMAPKLKDLHASAARRVQSTGFRRQADVTNGVSKSSEAVEMMEQPDVVAVPVRGDIVVHEHTGAWVDSSQLTDRALAEQQIKCGQRDFLASSLHLRRLHESILHAGSMVPSSRGLNVASAASELLKSAAEDTMTTPGEQYETPAIVGEAGPSFRPTSRSGRGENRCKKCLKCFQSKMLLHRHLVLVHNVYATCDACNANLMNKAAARNHVRGKHFSQQVTFTVLRLKSYTTSPQPAAAMSRDARTPRSTSGPSRTT